MSSSTQLQGCIYCTGPVDVLRGEGDHVVPAALGRFEDEFIFRRICRNCNSVIGRCEEQLLRCAPGTYLRRLVLPAVKRAKRGTSWVGAHGMPPPKATIDHGDHRESMEISSDDVTTGRPIDQVVLMDREGREQHVRLFPGMTAQQLRGKIEALGGLQSDRCFLHVDHARSSEYLALLREIWPERSVAEGPAREPGTHRVVGHTTFTFHADYWRAIAKIGFHYYLLNTQRGFWGDEPQFADLRRFIIEGGNHEHFFKERCERIIPPFAELADGIALLPPEWTHVLAADDTCKTAETMVSLFMGPQHLAPTYHIALCRLESPLFVPNACRMHLYRYEPQPHEGQYAGRVVAAPLTRLR